MKDFESRNIPSADAQDWIDGADTPEATAAARRFREASPDQAAEIDALRALAARLRQAGSAWREQVRVEHPDPAGMVDDVLLAARLDSLGETWRAATPDLHLERDVMALLDQEHRRAGTPGRTNQALPSARPGASGPDRRAATGKTRYPWQDRSRWMFRAAAVVAVCGLVGAGWVLMPGPRREVASLDSGPSQATPGARSAREPMPEPMSPSRQERTRLGDPSRSGLEQQYDALLRPVAPPVPVRVEAAEPDTRSARATLTLPELLDLKKRALARDAAAAARLEAEGSLSADEARQLLKRSDLSLDAFLGAVQFLPPDEAAGYLRQAVEQYPDSPYLRYLLARNLAMNEATRGEALVHLAALRELDPGNGLPNYLEARERLRDGDLVGALTALDVGRDFPQASAFSVEAARTRAAALEAAGRPEDEATFLAAATMGEAAYAELMALSQELLAQARDLESMREYQTAQAVTESVMSLGKVLADTSPSANEQLAGADIQMNALDFWVRLAELIASPEGIRSLTSTYQRVAGSVESVVTSLGLVSSAYETADPNTAAAMAQQAIRDGDLAAVSAITQANTATVQATE
ncbi:MAG TPA: hypothetical protein PK349_10990 [Candidatus Hydrogenedentes bacterium]|nr:hypothetical protein [Candidatus Hydrogenedentota bacterium]